MALQLSLRRGATAFNASKGSVGTSFLDVSRRFKSTDVGDVIGIDLGTTNSCVAVMVRRFFSAEFLAPLALQTLRGMEALGTVLSPHVMVTHSFLGFGNTQPTAQHVVPLPEERTRFVMNDRHQSNPLFCFFSFDAILIS
jgi:hypothetical protein